MPSSGIVEDRPEEGLLARRKTLACGKNFVYRVFAPILACKKRLELSPNPYHYNFDDEARPVISCYPYLSFPLFLSLYPLFPLML